MGNKHIPQSYRNQSLTLIHRSRWAMRTVYCREWIILSLVLCEARKPCKIIVQRELATEKTSTDNCPAAPEIHLLVHMQFDLPDSPDIVQILSGYCPAGQISRNFSVVKTGLIFNVWQFWDHPWGQFFTLYRFFMVLGPSLALKTRFFNEN